MKKLEGRRNRGGQDGPRLTSPTPPTPPLPERSRAKAMGPQAAGDGRAAPPCAPPTGGVLFFHHGRGWGWSCGKKTHTPPQCPSVPSPVSVSPSDTSMSPPPPPLGPQHPVPRPPDVTVSPRSRCPALTCRDARPGLGARCHGRRRVIVTEPRGGGDAEGAGECVCRGGGCDSPLTHTPTPPSPVRPAVTSVARRSQSAPRQAARARARRIVIVAHS